MDDPDYDYDGQQDATPARPRWLKPALLFAIALLSGALASGLWLKLHPRPAAALPSDAAVTLDPAHRALPSPMAGGSTSLPPPATPAADAPHVVSTAAEAASTPDSTAVDAAADGAETTQGTASQETDASSPADETVPQVASHVQPEYPADALRERVEGTVQLTLSIDAQGDVTDVRMARSSGSSELDRAAMDSVRGWHYRPATRDGQPVASTVDVPVDFKLDSQQ